MISAQTRSAFVDPPGHDRRGGDGADGLLSWLIARDVLGALNRQQSRMHSIANGSLDEAVGETERGDEIGRMAETLEVLRQTAMTARNAGSGAGRAEAMGRNREARRADRACRSLRRVGWSTRRPDGVGIDRTGSDGTIHD